MPRTILAVLALTTAACTNDQSIGAVREHVVADASKLDLLFVIDRSTSMVPKQAQLGQNLPRLMHELESLPGGLPSVHIGIVSTDMPVGAGAVEGCGAPGYDGALQNAPGIDGCTPPDGAFVSDEIGAGGQRIHNYSGTLEDAVGCIARLGGDGCGFEQPLAAMRAALDGTVAKNAGFLRPDAFLAVVFLTDEDDCSADDPGVLFGANPTDPNHLGPLASFRCTRWGLVCDQGAPDHAGNYTSCRSQTTGTSESDVADFVDFIGSIKDPQSVFVATVAGDPSRVTVARDDRGELFLSPSCDGPGGDADPPVRLTQFGRAFAAHQETLVCNDDFPDFLQLLGGQVRKLIVAYESDKKSDLGLSFGCTVAPGGAGGAFALRIALLIALVALRFRARKAVASR